MATTVKSHSRSVKGKGNTSVKRHARTVKKGGKWVSDSTAEQYTMPKSKADRKKFRDEMLAADAVNGVFKRSYKVGDEVGTNAPRGTKGLFKTNPRSVADGETLKLATRGTLKSKKASLASAKARHIKRQGKIGRPVGAKDLKPRKKRKD